MSQVSLLVLLSVMAGLFSYWLACGTSLVKYLFITSMLIGIQYIPRTTELFSMPTAWY